MCEFFEITLSIPTVKLYACKRVPESTMSCTCSSVHCVFISISFLLSLRICNKNVTVDAQTKHFNLTCRRLLMCTARRKCLFTLDKAEIVDMELGMYTTRYHRLNITWNVYDGRNVRQVVAKLKNSVSMSTTGSFQSTTEHIQDFTIEFLPGMGESLLTQATLLRLVPVSVGARSMSASKISAIEFIQPHELNTPSTFHRTIVISLMPHIHEDVASCNWTTFFTHASRAVASILDKLDAKDYVILFTPLAHPFFSYPVPVTLMRHNLNKSSHTLEELLCDRQLTGKQRDYLHIYRQYGRLTDLFEYMYSGYLMETCRAENSLSHVFFILERPYMEASVTSNLDNGEDEAHRDLGVALHRAIAELQFSGIQTSLLYFNDNLEKAILTKINQFEFRMTVGTGLSPGVHMLTDGKFTLHTGNCLDILTEQALDVVQSWPTNVPRVEPYKDPIYFDASNWRVLRNEMQVDGNQSSLYESRGVYWVEEELSAAEFNITVNLLLEYDVALKSAFAMAEPQKNIPEYPITPHTARPSRTEPSQSSTRIGDSSERSWLDMRLSRITQYASNDQWLGCVAVETRNFLLKHRNGKVNTLKASLQSEFSNTTRWTRTALLSVLSQAAWRNISQLLVSYYDVVCRYDLFTFENRFIEPLDERFCVSVASMNITLLEITQRLHEKLPSACLLALPRECHSSSECYRDYLRWRVTEPVGEDLVDCMEKQLELTPFPSYKAILKLSEEAFSHTYNRSHKYYKRDHSREPLYNRHIFDTVAMPSSSTLTKLLYPHISDCLPDSKLISLYMLREGDTGVFSLPINGRRYKRPDELCPSHCFRPALTSHSLPDTTCPVDSSEIRSLPSFSTAASVASNLPKCLQLMLVITCVTLLP